MKKSLTIAMPISSFLPTMGGMEVGLHNIASRLKARGHRPIVIMPFTQYRILKKHKWNLQYEVFPYLPKMSSISLNHPMWSQRIYSLYYRMFHRLKDVDVWHGTMIYPEGAALSQAFERCNVPVVVRAAGADIQINDDAHYGLRRDDRIDRLVRKWVSKLSAVVAITDTVRDEYITLGVKPERINNITNGVDTKRFKTYMPKRDIRSDYNISEDHFVFLSVGRNHPKKNYKTLLRVAVALKEKTDKFTVLIVGANTLSLKKDVEALGVERHVKLIDQVGADGTQGLQFPSDGLLDFYKSADAFIFPSKIETFGIAIIEAMAAGLACIVSNAPGCINVIENGAHALTCDPSDIEGYVSHALSFITDQDLKEDFALKASKRAADYDWDMVVDAYELLYYRPLKS